MRLDVRTDFLERIYGLSVRTCVPFGSGVVNENYRVVADEGEFVWKINTHKERARMEDELRMLDACAHLPVPHVRRDASGSFIHTYDGRHGWLYEMIQGEQLSIVTSEMARALGEMLGRIHVACADIMPFDQSGTWDTPHLCRIMDDFLSSHPIDVFGSGVDLISVRDRLRSFDFSALPLGMTHQDVKPENVLISDEKIVGILDFDNAYFGVLLHDVHTVAIWTCFDGDVLRTDLLDALYGGYESVRSFTSVERDFLHDSLMFRILREVFIGPYAATRVTDEVKKRSAYFFNLSKQFI